MPSTSYNYSFKWGYRNGIAGLPLLSSSGPVMPDQAFRKGWEAGRAKLLGTGVLGTVGGGIGGSASVGPGGGGSRPGQKPPQGNPSQGGKYSPAQLKDLWIKNGGASSAASMAAAIAMAESGGNANATNYNTNGSIDRGLWQINSVHGSLSTLNPNGNAKAAIQISKNGTDWSAWTTFQSGAYKQFLGSAQNATASASGGGAAGGLGDPLSLLTDLLTLNLSDLAVRLALVGVTVVKDVGLGFADWVIIPFWQWNQRAASYYVTDELFSTDTDKWTVLPWTAAFWGLGYWLLWTDPDSKNLKPTPVTNSRLARHARLLQSVPARRSLIKPKDVRSKTPKKPKPVISSALIAQTGTMGTERTRPVKVYGARVTETGTANNRPGESTHRPGSAEPNGSQRAPRESNSFHRSGGGSLPDSGGDTPRRTGEGEGNSRG